MDLTFIRYKERHILLLMDFFAFLMAHCAIYYLRFRSGLFGAPVGYWSLLIPALVTSAYWLVIFAMLGQYRPLYGKSRLDSLLATMKSTAVGIFIIFFLMTLDKEAPFTKGNVTLLIYWALLVGFAGGGRIVLRTVQHILLMKGVALSPALIVGFNERGKKLLDQTIRFPVMGYKVMGFVDDKFTEGVHRDIRVLGLVDDLYRLIPDYGVMEVILALSREDESLMERVIGICGLLGVRIKIMPELYHLVSGQVKVMGLYGVPLVEVFPDLMPPWAQVMKRLMDIVCSLLVLTVNLPVMLAIAVLIKLDSEGPIIYSQKRVGIRGKEFTLFKFRSMIKDAEAKTGAVWAEKDDPRITKVGRFLRKARLDELPQFFNVLKGNMSLVGPRPERKIFVDRFIKEIPLYSRRLNVKPGITGWAQVKYKYDESLDDVKMKLSYDLYYLENLSLKFDLKIMLLTFAVMLWGKGQ
ncbi:MAG: sugar transferase [candidate division Zixibacteria bacterium]|nr:sugar transferase [Candidatus Tariuqbacter arcticus]